MTSQNNWDWVAWTSCACPCLNQHQTSQGQEILVHATRRRGWNPNLRSGTVSGGRSYYNYTFVGGRNPADDPERFLNVLLAGAAVGATMAFMTMVAAHTPVPNYIAGAYTGAGFAYIAAYAQGKDTQTVARKTYQGAIIGAALGLSVDGVNYLVADGKLPLFVGAVIGGTPSITSNTHQLMRNVGLDFVFDIYNGKRQLPGF